MPRDLLANVLGGAEHFATGWIFPAKSLQQLSPWLKSETRSPLAAGCLLFALSPADLHCAPRNSNPAPMKAFCQRTLGFGGRPAIAALCQHCGYFKQGNSEVEKRPRLWRHRIRKTTLIKHLRPMLQSQESTKSSTPGACKELSKLRTSQSTFLYLFVTYWGLDRYGRHLACYEDTSF